MKHYLTRLFVWGILLSMSSELSGKDKAADKLLQRIFEYHQKLNPENTDFDDYVYAKFRFNVERRNPTMWLIPTMYVMARDPREYIRESYNKVHFNDCRNYEIDKQLLTSTIRHNRRAMPTLLDFATPNIYNIDLYDGHILSPFNKVNRRFYRFTVKIIDDKTSRLDFMPKLYNTQLLNGYAIVETTTGRIIRTILNGEFDMISFRTEIFQGEKGIQSVLPQKCTTAATFRFIGNRVSTIFNTTYNCPPAIPDSIDESKSRSLMDSIRPEPLSVTEKHIYEAYDQKHVQDSIADTIPKKTNVFKKIFWDTIGDQLVTPIAAESDKAEFYISPIVNPLYIRYSGSRGLSYKIRLFLRYSFSEHRYLTFEPTFGYNFKQRQFYFTTPLRITYNPKRNGYAEVVWGNGNRINNSSVIDHVLDHMNQESRDTTNFGDTDMDKFTDNFVKVFNNIMIFDWLDIESGIVFHQRVALNKEIMHKHNVPVEYRSFAPMIGLKFSPWLNRGPVFSVDWERSIKGILKANLDYERWEFDAQWKHRLPGLRVLSLRHGLGFYTRKNENYFLDYANFQDNNLPEGWDDNWSGEFQLLDGRVYNESDYYIRTNVSYESPLLFATWLPYVGKYIEKERLYLNSVLVQNTRPYFELGYGLTNRFFSIGLFASFYNASFQKFGVTFDFELFKRW